MSGRIGAGGVVHVSRTVFDILAMSVSSDVQADCHCSVVRFVWFVWFLSN
jgi:hypothetical protein